MLSLTCYKPMAFGHNIIKPNYCTYVFVFCTYNHVSRWDHKKLLPSSKLAHLASFSLIKLARYFVTMVSWTRCDALWCVWCYLSLRLLNVDFCYFFHSPPRSLSEPSAPWPLPRSRTSPSLTGFVLEPTILSSKSSWHCVHINSFWTYLFLLQIFAPQV